MHKQGFYLPPGIPTILEVEVVARWAMAQADEVVGSKLRLFGLRQKKKKNLKFTQMPKAIRDKSKGNAPTVLKKHSAAARNPLEYSRCWCRGFNVGCGLIRLTWMCREHADNERKKKEKNEAHRQLPLENVDLRVGEDQPHNMTTGPQGDDTLYFNFDFIHSFSPGLELGSLPAVRHH